MADLESLQGKKRVQWVSVGLLGSPIWPWEANQWEQHCCQEQSTRINPCAQLCAKSHMQRALKTKWIYFEPICAGNTYSIVNSHNNFERLSMVIPTLLLRKLRLREAEWGIQLNKGWGDKSYIQGSCLPWGCMSSGEEHSTVWVPPCKKWCRCWALRARLRGGMRACTTTQKDTSDQGSVQSYRLWGQKDGWHQGGCNGQSASFNHVHRHSDTRMWKISYRPVVWRKVRGIGLFLDS